MSPLFTLGEGIATLLVIQVAGRVGKGWADEDQADEGGVEWRSLMGLVLAAGLYVAGLAGVVKVSTALLGSWIHVSASYAWAGVTRSRETCSIIGQEGIH